MRDETAVILKQHCPGRVLADFRDRRSFWWRQEGDPIPATFRLIVHRIAFDSTRVSANVGVYTRVPEKPGVTRVFVQNLRVARHGFATEGMKKKSVVCR
jgi:hypothetical protein